MTKIHTRVKRRLGLSTHIRHLVRPKRANRPKTFATEDAAKIYAGANGIAKYSLKSVKKYKRFQIVEGSEE